MANQHTREIILFKSKSSPISELIIADKNRVVLYTENPEVLKKFRTWQQLLLLVPYSQLGKQIAADLYFPLSAKGQLLRALSKDF